jgi:hypothetical protein
VPRRYAGRFNHAYGGQIKAPRVTSAAEPAPSLPAVHSRPGGEGVWIDADPVQAAGAVTLAT